MKKMNAIMVAIIGVACIVLGIMFIMQANTSQQKVADELAPVQISEVDAKYEQVSAALKAATDPAQITSLTLTKTSLGLAKSNIGTIKFLQNSGIVNIIIGAGFSFAGLGLLKKDERVTKRKA